MAHATPRKSVLEGIGSQVYFCSDEPLVSSRARCHTHELLIQRIFGRSLLWYAVAQEKGVPAHHGVAPVGGLHHGCCFGKAMFLTGNIPLSGVFRWNFIALVMESLSSSLLLEELKVLALHWKNIPKANNVVKGA